MKEDPEDFLPLSPAAFHILVVLADRERHGYGIIQEVERHTNGKLRLSPGTLYGAIKRMLDEGLIAETGQCRDPKLGDERRRYYRLTDFGRKVAGAETERLSKLVSQAIASLLPKKA